ncbi:MAG: type IV pilin N-terminal domain-containing protein [Thaumarchaeota archaeon]|nr:type IV pilin N-terminal domain-containing protein [Nitrososphaerota archaeon]
MKTIKEYRQHQRKAISPIIATVLIIAVTLVASVAIGGFVFGLFGSSTVTAQVQAIAASIPSSISTGSTFTAVCATAQGAAGYTQFSNTGTANTIISTISITFGGVSYSAALGGSSCTVTAGSSLYVQISFIPAGATAGSQYSGFVVTANGAQVVFTGAFQ